jgi:hypothetical protein
MLSGFAPWQAWQFMARIGAICLLKLTGCAAIGAATNNATLQRHRIARAAASRFLPPNLILRNMGLLLTLSITQAKILVIKSES